MHDDDDKKQGRMRLQRLQSLTGAEPADIKRTAWALGILFDADATVSVIEGRRILAHYAAAAEAREDVRARLFQGGRPWSNRRK